MPTTGSDMTTERGNLSVGQQKGQGIMEPILGYARRHGVGVEANVRVARGNLRVSIGSGHSWSGPAGSGDGGGDGPLPGIPTTGRMDR